ncbi:DGQHR domain-containing protein [Porticoccus sp.]|uniref:DGQHR domain-containing protein n=1 Tax=Porticoccus sp. TaxID=2024853 RepID=UPI000C3567CE|nr:DGQHR domain-containing protein [Porticoccus sp.]MAZ70865.1 hypothetical protein [Porticoccus sp.]
MSFIDPVKVEEIRNKFVVDPSMLGKIYKSKKNKYMEKSVDHSLVEDYLRDGWEDYTKPLKTKTKLRKLKSYDQQFEDDIWCQFYELGYRILNFDRQFILPYGKSASETQQIDVIAVNDETIILVECKSSEKPVKAPSFKTELESLPLKLDGYRKSLAQIFDNTRRIKYIFATRNLRIDLEGSDVERIYQNNAFYYNDNTYKYIERLIKLYKSAAHYQVLGMLFKGQQIGNESLRFPAIEGKMGGHTYYMFSIEPSILLKLGFILHRTAANESESPTYQRLLVPSRLRGITSFINNGGYFPNSVILNFTSSKKQKIRFEADSREGDSDSRSGTLVIPKAYAIAYIIDGQHRLYGYSGSNHEFSNTIPAVAFIGLDSTDQLKIFMDINENQKAVSASLRLTLEEDLYWNSERIDSRLKALRSAVVRELASTAGGPLYEKIQIGEDKAALSFKGFADALSKSSLIPKAKRHEFIQETTKYGLYNTHNHNHEKEMTRAKKSLVNFINTCYSFVQEDYPEVWNMERYFIFSNRGIIPFIGLISDLNKFENELGTVNTNTKPSDRFESIKKYLIVLLEKLNNMSEQDSRGLLSTQGSEVERQWLRFYQSIINDRFPNYNPPELVDYKERQDTQLQNRGREVGVAIEKHIKDVVISRLKELYGDNWDLEIATIKKQCQDRADAEIQAAYEQGLGRKTVDWTEMFTILNYKTIIEKHWTKHPQVIQEEFKTFEDVFALDMGLGNFNSKADKVKWMAVFNSHRNLWAHEGSKKKTLNREEVEFLEDLHQKLIGTSASV